MKTVKITEILEYYDGILAFSAQDPIGGHYVGSLIEKTRKSDRYLVVGTKPECLDDLRNGKIDLRTLLLETPSGEWYITTPEGTIDDPLILEPQQTPLAETDYLPGDGYFLDDEPPDVAAAIRPCRGQLQQRMKHHTHTAEVPSATPRRSEPPFAWATGQRGALCNGSANPSCRRRLAACKPAG